LCKFWIFISKYNKWGWKFKYQTYDGRHFFCRPECFWHDIFSFPLFNTHTHTHFLSRAHLFSIHLSLHIYLVSLYKTHIHTHTLSLAHTFSLPLFPHTYTLYLFHAHTFESWLCLMIKRIQIWRPLTLTLTFKVVIFLRP